MREIGSEFHMMPFESGHGFGFPGKGNLVFSGRTAIETVLKELPNARRAVLPSYCCDSMIQPFRDAEIEIDFYPVYFDNGLKIEVNLPEDTDIFLWCNYFGFSNPMPDLSGYKGAIIEDITHSLLSKQTYDFKSNYLVASVRKWEPINCGGYCAAVNEELHHIPVKFPPQKFVERKSMAMKLKTEYLNEIDEEKKTRFLSMFDESNDWLANNYFQLTIDPWSREYLESVDIDEHRKIRRQNAKVLYEGLKKAQFLFREEDMDCPLFVPILLCNRDMVRQVLIENQIYCPVHWPKPEKCESNLYNLELSLICDQRYSEDDMVRIVSVLDKLL